MPGKIFLSTPGGGGTSYPYTPADVAGSTGPLTVLGGTQTGASTPFLNLSQTWNNAATTFTGALVNVTDTASAAASLLLDCQVGGVTKFKVRKDGYVTAGNALDVGATSPISWISRASMRSPVDGQLQLSDFNLTKSVTFSVDANHLLALRSGVNAQSLFVYNTYTDASNYERGVFDWTTTGNTLTIGTVKAGTGTARSVNLISASDINLLANTAGPTIKAANGNLQPNSSSNPALTNNFICISTTAGAPTGTPGGALGNSTPIHFDNTSKKLYVWDPIASGWKSTAALT